MKLTLARIGNLKCPAGKRDMLVFDDEQRGLGVRVTAGGSKTYLAPIQLAWAEAPHPARELQRPFVGQGP
jgi:hypothetical protein